MALRIGQDHSRYREIVRGRIRRDLRKYLTHGELLGRQGNKSVSIPLPQVDIPRFRHAEKQQGGVAQGEGDVGDSLGGDPQEGSSGAGEAGQDPGEHPLEVELSFDELADILGEALALPAIEPRGRPVMDEKKSRYVGVRPVGPNSLKHFKRTFRQALRRQISSGTYDRSNPVIIPSRSDMRYKAPKLIDEPAANAVIIYMMDVSGSMGQDQKDIVRTETFWIDVWLRKHYPKLATRYIIHDAVAREVDRDTFFRTRESGGTMISSAYQLAAKIIETDYPREQWNIYPFHFSDGDNWSGEDTQQCLTLMQDVLLPVANVFCYGQVESPYGSGQFLKDLSQHFKDDARLIISEIRNRDAIIESIRDFLGTGK